MLVSSLLLLIPALLLLMLLWALHSLSPLSGSRPVGTEPLHWGPCCLVLCRVPFAENDFCLAADNLPAVDIVATAGGVAAVAAIPRED